MIFEDLRRAYPPGCVARETPSNGSAFVAGLVSLYTPKNVVEVGCCNGVTSAYIARALSELPEEHSFTAYEMDGQYIAPLKERLAAAWPGGSWRVAHGDFFKLYDDAPVDFAFIDIDPKELYLKVYQRIKWSAGAVIVAHDLCWKDYDRQHVNVLGDFMRRDEWKTFGFEPARGFLFGVKP